MGRLKLQSGIKAIEEEPEDYDTTCSNKATLTCMINSEVRAVLAVMRRNVRWEWSNQWHTINPVAYLQLFLDVIKSDETGPPITGVVLSSVHKILTLDVIDQNTVNVEEAMHLVVDSVTSCRFEVTDPASEEVVVMKILQVLLACMKSKASVMLSNQHVSTIVNTCFRIVHQAEKKGELLQRIARHTMHELVRYIFSHLSNVENTKNALVNRSSTATLELSAFSSLGGIDNDYAFGAKQTENGNGSVYDGQASSGSFGSNSAGLVGTVREESMVVAGDGKETIPYDLHLMTAPYGVPCMVEIFHFLCSLLNAVEHMGTDPRSNTLAFDEDVPLFALGLINSAIELGGPSFRRHPRLLSMIQDELFCNLMQFGLSMSPLILSMGKYGPSYQQQEVAIETLVDFCWQKTFMVEMYANLDCDITCRNVFEDLANLLSKSAFHVNCPLSAMHILALDGLIAVIQGMAERIGNGSISSAQTPVILEVKCDNYADPVHWVPFVRRRKYIKRRLMFGVDHFNRDPKKGLEFLQGTHLLPDKLEPQSVACFFRYTAGLDKNLVGDFLGNHDEFCVQVLHEFAGTFDLQDMNLVTALRLSWKLFDCLENHKRYKGCWRQFSERYYEQSPQILANKDAALLLSYSLIMLNTDQHNVQVKKKMTEEDFIRNNRHINGGNDLPREFLSELYHSICKNEIRTTPDQGFGYPEMTPSRWIDLMQKSKKTAPFIVADSRAYLDHDMFAIMSAVAKISACHNLEDVLDDLVVCLCKFTTLLNPSSVEEPVLAFGDDTKARMATVTVFTIANRYGDYIRTGWRNILDCILRLHKLGLLPARVASDAADESELSSDPGHGKPITNSLSSP
ncbi:ARF guanine-nucleotide exchange factor GNOM [Hibiscus syriacus]|uniref:ARF guanine-nucleotide exchange factor GNOM n=1 Tax=Hibiscus syriacus TaxID=106335 RepID=A0A6A2Y6C8_HIBSY|nr:ARF guanine-nucleotide exchange factor GNOM [Hibiscus syriacus]